MIGLFVGRFQPFHLGHLQVIKDILKENEKIIIVIGSAQESNTKRNPFSAKEREEMIKRTLNKEGIKNYEIFLANDFFDDREWTENIKRHCKFDVAYSRNPHVLKCFKEGNVKTKLHKFYNRDVISGSEIRRRIANDEEWKKFVPEEVAKYIEEIRGEERVKETWKK